MQYKLPLFFLILSLSSFALNKNCKPKIDNIVNEMHEWDKYGIKRDPTGVVQFPTKCTPFMKNKGMIPLTKRKSAGVNRERYLGKDCKVYEWDSQHGAFEVYSPNSNNTFFYHEGENSVVTGKSSPKAMAKRNNDFSDTGIPGMKMKDLCKKHKTGKITTNDLKRSNVKSLLKCI